jgi:hypothetical protein
MEYIKQNIICQISYILVILYRVFGIYCLYRRRMAARPEACLIILKDITNPFKKIPESWQGIQTIYPDIQILL